MDGWRGVKAVLRIVYSNQKTYLNLVKSTIVSLFPNQISQDLIMRSLKIQTNTLFLKVNSQTY